MAYDLGFRLCETTVGQRRRKRFGVSKEESPTALLQRLFGTHPTHNYKLREMGEHQGGRTSFQWVPDEGARAPGQETEAE